MAMKRWQDWVNLVLGIWLFVSPMVLGWGFDLPAATWNAWISGLAVFILAGSAVYMPRTWEEASNVILGLWLMISPWALGFEMHMQARNTMMLTGLLVAAFALWAMVMDTDVRRWLHEHHLMR